MQLWDSTFAEIWTPVVGYEGYYSVSSFGRVRSEQRPFTFTNRWGHEIARLTKPRILRARRKPSGHLALKLSVNGKVTDHSVHRLVCEAFHGPPPFLEAMAAHGDGDPSNNRADNLRWATHQENQADKAAHGTIRAGRNPNARLTAAQVEAIRADRHHSQAELARMYGVCASTIGNVRRGATWAPDEPLDTSYLATNWVRLRAKLRPEQVAEIRASSDASSVLAERFGVSKSNITAIRRRKSWASL